MSEKTKIDIPEEIVNEVVAMTNQVRDLRKEALWLVDKAKLQNAKIWDLIGDKVKETRGVPCSLDVDNRQIILNSTGGIEDVLRQLLEG